MTSDPLKPDGRTTVPRLSSTVLDAPDPHALAAFYRDLLGWQITSDLDDTTWVVVRPPGGGTGLAFQEEPLHEAPAWPSARGVQQMQLHLDLQVPELGPAVRRAEELGARQAEHQPQDDVRVMVDPVGHIFCLFEL